MNNLRILALFLIATLSSSCVMHRQAVQDVTLPPQRITQYGYSLVPLDEVGWVIGYRDSERIVLGKRGSDPDENIIIRAFSEVLPPLQSEEEFIGFSKSVLFMEGASRHKVISQQTELVRYKSQPCVRTDTVMEDHGAVKRTSRTELMILEAYSLLCKHPNGSTGILVAYSHRYYQGHKEVESRKKAQKIFDSIEFSSL